MAGDEMTVELSVIKGSRLCRLENTFSHCSASSYCSDLAERYTIMLRCARHRGNAGGWKGQCLGVQQKRASDGVQCGGESGRVRVLVGHAASAYHHRETRGKEGG